MTVYLIGAGPGDPDLLTVKASRLISSAQVVVHDRLVSDDIMALIPATAERIDVGKRAGGSHTQVLINELLVTLGRNHQHVVRLKGGDPFVFGRGGEEAEALIRAGVSFEIVPGISSAFAVPALAGIPVTHRRIARAVTVVTGHCEDPNESVNWSAHAKLEQLWWCLWERQTCQRSLLTSSARAWHRLLLSQSFTTEHVQTKPFRASRLQKRTLLRPRPQASS
jgi:uroporphyrin-III C-methyltransferase